MKEELGTGDMARILGMSVTSVKNLIYSQKLRGWITQPSGEYKTFLSLLVRFIEENNFQRGSLLSFLEGEWAEQSDPTRFRITEPLGVGKLRFYPQTYHTLTTGQIANLSNVCARTAATWIDDGLLDGFQIPISEEIDGSGGYRRVPADNYLRFVARRDIPYEGQGLEKKTTLLVGYPGDWEDEHKLTNDGSLWYKQTEASQEISVRDNADGLYVIECDDTISLILTGMTGRKGYGQVAHPNHINRIYKFLGIGVESARTIGDLARSGTIIGILENAQKILSENYELTIGVPKPKEKVLSPV